MHLPNAHDAHEAFNVICNRILLLRSIPAICLSVSLILSCCQPLYKESWLLDRISCRSDGPKDVSSESMKPLSLGTFRVGLSSSLSHSDTQCNDDDAIVNGFFWPVSAHRAKVTRVEPICA